MVDRKVGDKTVKWPDLDKDGQPDETVTIDTTGDGKPDGTWNKIGPNEAIDLYGYAYAACVRLGADRMDWAAPRPWAAPWDENPEVLDGEQPEQGRDATGPARMARRVRFRMRG